MNRKVVSGTVLILLVMSMLVFAFNIQQVKASGTICIRADGSIYPPTAPISTVDNVTYTFTDNIYDEIVVERDNVVVDGASYTLQGTGNGTGIALSYRSNVTIKSMEIKGFKFGICFVRSNHNSISGNNITNNDFDGILLIHTAKDNSISGNIITNNGWGGINLWGSSDYNSISRNIITNNNNYGILLEVHSSYNSIYDNTVTNNGYGILLDFSSKNTFRNNDVSNNKYNFGVYGHSIYHYIQDMDNSNTVNGKPVYYLVNRQDVAIPPDAGWFALTNCTRITARNLNLTNNSQGVLLAYTTESTITKSNITDNEYGMWVYNSSNNAISENTIADNEYGMKLEWFSNYNSICQNNITSNNNQGIWLQESSNNTISGNKIEGNNYVGIKLFGLADNNSIDRNNIINHSVGIWLELSLNNIIYHNNFINNTNQVESIYSMNVWDDGYPSGGNYWDDYGGVDLYSGSYQNEIGSDGIGDTPYVIEENNRDNYPLIDPWVPLLGDLNCDGIVDVTDIYIVAGSFGLYLNHLDWNPTADINGDETVDIVDVYLVAINFGKTHH